MATPNNLVIHNQRPDQTLLLLIAPDDYWNCCDSPLPNQIWDGLMYNHTSSIYYLRKDGHGCNGRQGQFTLSIYANSKFLGQQQFNFDADGIIGLTGPASGFNGNLSGQDFFVLP